MSNLLKIINIGDPGTGFRFGGDDLDTVNRLLSGEDLDYLLKMQNIFYFGGASKLRLLRPNNINYIPFVTEAETSGNWAIIIPPLTADQKMLFESVAATVSKKTIDLRDNTVLRLGRYGAYRPNVEVSAEGEGALKGLVGIGTKVVSHNNTGKNDIWSTRAVLNDIAGLVKLDTFVCQRTVNPLFRYAFIFVPPVSNNRRVFKGVGPKRLIDAQSDTAPLTNTESGVFFGHGSTDTQWQVFYNDGTGPCQKVSTGLNLPAVATNLIVEIKANDSVPNFVVSIYSMGLGGVRGSLLATPTTLTTRIPGQTTNLYWQDLVSAATASAQPNYIHYDEVEI